MATSINIKQLIESSAVLSETERKEWLDLLPFMNDKQQSELLLILQPSPAVVEPEHKLSAAPPASQVQTPAPASPPAPVVSHTPDQTSPATATTVSAFLNRNFASELHRGSIPGTFRPEDVSSSVESSKVRPSQLQPLQKPEAAPLTAPKPNEVPVATHNPAVLAQKPPLPSFGAVPQQKSSTATVGSRVSEIPQVQPVAEGVREAVPNGVSAVDEPVVHARSLEAVRMLNVATLRGSGVVNVESELKALCEKFGYFSVQFAFEQSPLYQAYIAVGARILKEHRTFEEVQAALASAGRPYLTKPEFEEFSDLIRRLKGHP